MERRGDSPAVLENAGVCPNLLVRASPGTGICAATTGPGPGGCWHPATTQGPLSEHTTAARITYHGTWYTDNGQVSAEADYGTTALDRTTANGQLERPATGQAGRIVTWYDYDGYNRLEKVTNNRGIVTKYAYDSLGRKQFVIENYLPTSTYWNIVDGAENYNAPQPHTADMAVNRVTKYDYNDLGQVSMITAVDPNCDGNTADNQETRYVYSLEVTDQYCPVSRNDLLVAVIYPDSDDRVSSGHLQDNNNGYDRVEFTYYADGSPRSRKDQRKVIHYYIHDDWGRLTGDYIANGSTMPDQTATYASLSWPTGVDDRVKAITYGFDDEGRPNKVTSLGGANFATFRNEVLLKYEANGWGRVVTKRYEAHNSEVDEQTTPYVEFTYEDGVTTTSGPGKYLRLAQVGYPKVSGGTSRVVYYRYGTAGSIGERLNRLESMDDNGSPANVFVQYAYLGAGTIVRVAHPAVNGGLTLTYGSPGSYSGLDSLDRVIDQRWENSNGNALDEFQYQYDTGSNRTYRVNKVQTTDRDEGYEYDSLDRLKLWKRGTAGGQLGQFTGPTTIRRRQQFGLDQVGNWATFNEDTNGSDPWGLTQTRSHNKANEIDTDEDHDTGPGASITGNGNGSWIAPKYDAAGNMTTMPEASIEDTYPNESTSAKEFTYDAWNRPVEARNVVTGSASVVLARYRYDGNHHRIAKLNVQDRNPETGVPTTWERVEFYYNNDWQLLEVRYGADIAAGSEESPVTGLARQYLWDIRYVDAPVMFWSDTTACYMTTDANHNVTGVFLGWNTTYWRRYRYTPYGRVTHESSGGGAPSNCDFLFAGYFFDGETNLYLARRRYYHPTLARWTSRDPKEYVDGMSLYEYCRSRPTCGTDPRGENWEWWRERAEWTFDKWTWICPYTCTYRAGQWVVEEIRDNVENKPVRAALGMADRLLKIPTTKVNFDAAIGIGDSVAELLSNPEAVRNPGGYVQGLLNVNVRSCQPAWYVAMIPLDSIREEYGEAPWMRWVDFRTFVVPRDDHRQAVANLTGWAIDAPLLVYSARGLVGASRTGRFATVDERLARLEPPVMLDERAMFRLEIDKIRGRGSPSAPSAKASPPAAKPAPAPMETPAVEAARAPEVRPADTIPPKPAIDPSNQGTAPVGPQLRAKVGATFGEYMHFRAQGFSPAQAKYLTQTYDGWGHHFLSRSRAGRWGVPEFITESVLNVMKPEGISIGRLYERHFLADPYFNVARFPKAIGGNWEASMTGLQRPGFVGRLWYGSPQALKVTVGGAAAAGGAAGIYWWINSGDE